MQTYFEIFGSISGFGFQKSWLVMGTRESVIKCSESVYFVLGTNPCIWFWVRCEQSFVVPQLGWLFQNVGMGPDCFESSIVSTVSKKACWLNHTELQYCDAP